MRGKLGQIATGVAAAIVVFGAVPAVLAALVGLPVPAHWDRQAVVSWHGLFDLLAVVAWVAWAACCLPLLRSVAARVRARDATVRTDARFPEWLATRIAAAVLAVGALGSSAVSSAGAVPARPAAVVSAAAGGGGRSAITTATVVLPEAPAEAPAPTPGDYTVEPGDSLWSIAQDLYGDGGDWTAIAAANLDRVMDDGTRFVDPSLLMPGWVLSIPDLDGPGARAPSGAPVTEASAAPVTEASAAPVTEASVADAPPPARTSADRHGARHTPGPSHPDRRDTRRRAGRAGRPAQTPRPSGLPLPELVALGLGVLAASALARRARRTRQLASLRRLDGELPAPVPELAASAGSLLAAFEGAAVVQRVELANRHLGAALAGTGAVRPSAARLVRVGPDGVEVRLKEPARFAPEGWELTGEGWWLLPAAADLATLSAAAPGQDPWLSVLLPLGDNDEGSWLVPLSAGECLPVLGPMAEAMVSAMVAASQSWVWAEAVVVTSDPAVVAQQHRPGEGNGRPAHRAPVLFVGDPGRLAPEVRSLAAVVTTRPLPATDLTVVIDARAASLHPLGVTLRPNLLDGDVRRGVGQLFEEPAGPAAPEPPHRPPRRRASPRAMPARAEVAVAQLTLDRPGLVLAPDRPRNAGAEPTAPVEVRLLTAWPRIDGLAEPLDPKRARRATELVAYLALHHPDPVTSDRLRNRVLGSADADAASKTLFNTVGAARRALGLDPAGEPLLPAASKSGHYRLSGLVTTDVARAEGLVAAAAEADDDEVAIALLRAALDLVEGEPLAGVLTGYGWWAAEGHERRIAATVVDGACRMAALAADRGFLDLARWGLERARLVEPYSEVLARAAMRVAAVAGDAERLRREWVDCQRWVDELDPGGLPSEATERLYADLRRRVPAGAGSDPEG